MNSKKLILLGLLIWIVFTADAQLFKYGADLGLNLSGHRADVKTTSLTGFQGGVMAELKLPVLVGVEMDIKYSQKGATLGPDKLALAYIDVPILVKLYFLRVASFQIGPQYSQLLSANFAGTDVKDNYNNGDFSAALGFGLDIFNLHASMRYNFGLTNISAFEGEKIRNNWFQFSLGYWFSKRD